MLRVASFAGFLLVLSGCLGLPTSPLSENAATDVPALAFSPPLKLTTGGEGFEPSIAAGPDGLLVATAAKTERPAEGTRLSSWIWYSDDGGASWRDLPLPTRPETAYWGAEGDIAVDALGRTYFVDIYLADAALTRWSPGPTWDWTRAAIGTTAPIDDRPWIAAHGDGVVYLMINSGPDFPTTEDLRDGRLVMASKWLYRSTDAGQTWTLGQGVPGTFCIPVGSPADDQTLLVSCHMGEGEGSRMEVRWSTDRGESLPVEFSPQLELGAVFMAPGAAIDRAGTGYAAWLDDRVVSVGFQQEAWAGDTPGRVRYAARAADGTWAERDVTPFAARFAELHASAGAPGTLALSFYATSDLEVTAASPWYPYAMVSHDADGPEPTWSLARLSEEPAGVGTEAPEDFFECVVASDNAVHVIFQVNKPSDDLRDGFASGVAADVFTVRQLTGANLDPAS